MDSFVIGLLVGAGVAIAAMGPLWFMQFRSGRRARARVSALEEQHHASARELDRRATELSGLHDTLLQVSLTDPLTGLRNRRFLFDHMSKDFSLVKRKFMQTIDLGERDQLSGYVFLLVDLDGFRRVNEAWGHQCGDELLVQTQGVLQSAMRESDVLMRWGEDAFLVVARDTDHRQAAELAERICARFREQGFALDDTREARITASIGFSCFPFMRRQPALVSWEEVLSIADCALKVAKRSSEDSWVGITSNDRTMTTSLMSSLREDVDRLAGAGMIDIHTSIPVTELAWR